MDKKMIALVTAAIMVAFVLGIIVAPSRSGTTTPAATTSDGSTAVTIVAIHDGSNRLYRIDAEYPQFKGASDAFNRSIAKYVTDGIAEFKANAEENWKARQDTMPAGQPKEEFPTTPFTYSATWGQKQINGRYYSIIVRIDSYEGGANGRQELQTFNYDVTKKKKITLGDLFPNDAMYLGKLAKYAYDRLSEDLASASGGHVEFDMLSQGTAPIRDNFENFMFNDDVIDLYFPKYQVAPGVFGEQHVIVPRKGAW